MKVSDAILQLMQIRDKYGDLSIEGCDFTNYMPPEKIIVIDEYGLDASEEGTTPTGIFLQ